MKTHYHDRLCQERSCDGLPLDAENRPAPFGEPPSCNACLALLGAEAAPSKGLTFGEAIDAAKADRKVRRRGWNGNGMWIGYMPPVTIPEGVVNGRTKRLVPTGDLRVGAYFVMWTADGTWQPGWLASQTDMLAEDWEIVAE